MVLTAAAGRGSIVTLDVLLLTLLSLVSGSCFSLGHDLAAKKKKVQLMRDEIKIRYTDTPEKCLIHSRRKKSLSARHASYSARIKLKPRPQVADGLTVST